MQYNHFSIQLQGKINYLIDHFRQPNRLNWLHRKHTTELTFPSAFSIQAGYHSIYIKLLRDYHVSFLIYAGSIPLAFSTDWITTWDIQKNLHLGQILPSLNSSELKEWRKISWKGLKRVHHSVSATRQDHIYPPCSLQMPTYVTCIQRL